MKSYYIKHRNDVFDRKEITRYITSFTLGDGFLWKAHRGKNAHYGTSRIKTSLDFVLWEMRVLSQITKTRILFIPENGMHKESVRMVTMTHPIYTNIWERMYAYGRKSFTEHDLKLFNVETLAVLYMDDGFFDRTSQYSYRSGIATDNFTEPEQKMLRDVIADKCNVHADIVRYKNRFRLRFNRKQTDILFDQIQSYVAPSYYYKIRQQPSIETVASWYYGKIQDDGIVRSLLKDSEYYRNIIP